MKRKRIKKRKDTKGSRNLRVASKKKGRAIDWRLLVAGGGIVVVFIALLMLGQKKNKDEDDDEKKVKNPLQSADHKGYNDGVVYPKYVKKSTFEELNLGVREEEERWFEQYVKGKNKGNKEAELKACQGDGNVVLNLDAFGKLYQPDIEEVVKGIREKIQSFSGDSGVEITISHETLLQRVAMFFETYEKFITGSPNRVGNKEANNTVENKNKNRAQYLDNLTFDDDYGAIRFREFKANMTDPSQVRNQLSERTLGIKKTQALVLVYYVFMQLNSCLYKGKSKSQDKGEDTKDLEAALNAAEAIMGLLAGIFAHCHDRTKDVFLSFLIC